MSKPVCVLLSQSIFRLPRVEITTTLSSIISGFLSLYLWLLVKGCASDWINRGRNGRTSWKSREISWNFLPLRRPSTIFDNISLCWASRSTAHGCNINLFRLYQENFYRRTELFFICFIMFYHFLSMSSGNLEESSENNTFLLGFAWVLLVRAILYDIMNGKWGKERTKKDQKSKCWRKELMKNQNSTVLQKNFYKKILFW